MPFCAHLPNLCAFLRALVAPRLAHPSLLCTEESASPTYAMLSVRYLSVRRLVWSSVSTPAL